MGPLEVLEPECRWVHIIGGCLDNHTIIAFAGMMERALGRFVPSLVHRIMFGADWYRCCDTGAVREPSERRSLAPLCSDA